MSPYREAAAEPATFRRRGAWAVSVGLLAAGVAFVAFAAGRATVDAPARARCERTEQHQDWILRCVDEHKGWRDRAENCVDEAERIFCQ